MNDEDDNAAGSGSRSRSLIEMTKSRRCEKDFQIRFCSFEIWYKSINIVCFTLQEDSKRR